MYLMYCVSSCFIGVLLLAFREVMRQRLVRCRQERLCRAIRGVVARSEAAKYVTPGMPPTFINWRPASRRVA